jgi:mannose-6-phosphate isomerase-like protein (cupin superfamily)
MEAQTFEVKTPLLTGGRSIMPLARTDLISIGINFYSPGRKNSLHTHPGEDHAFVVLDGEVTFYDKDNNATVLKKGQGIMLPEGWYYRFENTGGKPLALLRFSAWKQGRKLARIEAAGRTRGKDATEYEHVDGTPIKGQYWELS